MLDLPLHRVCGIEWSVASRALPGEAVSGDEHIVAPSRDGVLIAVIDGLGHGDQATLAARKAAGVLEARPGDPVVTLIQECHRALRDTRGAAMTLLSLNRRARTAAALGIGNVETVFVRAQGDARPRRESVLLRNGVVGYQLPPLHATVLSIAPGDLVVLATDGVREDFGDRLDAFGPLPRLVARILEQNYRGTDDALVLACKILDDDEA